jgi:E3 Ubiquitin ligase
MAILFAIHQSSSAIRLYVCAALLVYLGVKIVISGIKTYGKSKTLERATIVPLNRITAGLTHVRGNATGDDRSTSPLTKVPCYYYQVQVTKHFSRLTGGSGWTVVAKESEQRQFYLDDGMAKVLVNPLSAEYEVAETFRIRMGRASSRYIHPALGVTEPTDQDLQALVEPRWGKGKYRFSEFCLPADRQCNVLGHYAENPDPKNTDNRTLIMKGQKQQPFLISSVTQKQEEKSLRKKAVASIATGVYCIVLAAICGLMGLGIFFPME